jgi:hypothetical protein
MRTYVIYASEHDGVLRTSSFMRSRPLSEATEDIRYLENLAAGRPQALSTATSSAASLMPTAIQRGSHCSSVCTSSRSGVAAARPSGRTSGVRIKLSLPLARMNCRSSAKDDQ